MLTSTSSMHFTGFDMSPATHLGQQAPTAIKKSSQYKPPFRPKVHPRKGLLALVSRHVNVSHEDSLAHNETTRAIPRRPNSTNQHRVFPTEREFFPHGSAVPLFFAALSLTLPWS